VTEIPIFPKIFGKMGFLFFYELKIRNAKGWVERVLRETYF